MTNDNTVTKHWSERESRAVAAWALFEMLDHDRDDDPLHAYAKYVFDTACASDAARP